MYRKTQIVIAVLIGVAMLLSACGTAPATQSPEAAAPEEQPTTAPVVAEVATEAPAAPAESGLMLPDIDPATLTGKVVTAGSSTVFPLSEAMAERFKDEGFAGEITIDSIGSGAGYERFCKTGETDIANASRGIKDSEVENCAAIGRTPIEFRVGTDAIAVVVSSENDFATDVTLAELGMIFSSAVTKWSDVRPEWPNEDIRRFSPGTDSGTFDFFVEAVVAPNFKNADGKADIEAAKTDILKTSNLQLSEDDNVLVQGVEGSKYAIGYFGFAYFAENSGNLKALSIDSVAPSGTSAEDGSYVLARPLFIYSDAQILKDKPSVAGFINFYLTYVNEEIETVGYFPASQEALDAAKQALLDALK